MKHLDTSLYFITDSTGLSEEEFLRRTEEALQGGVTLFSCGRRTGPPGSICPSRKRYTS